MFPKLLQGFQGFQGIRGFAKRVHTQMCIAALFDQRRKVENEWDDDEHEQKRAFQEEETRIQRQQQQQQQQQQLKCEITDKAKRPGSIDCTCKGMCMVRKSETHFIHYEGGVGIIPKK
jgi:hypothetical protein